MKTTALLKEEHEYIVRAMNVLENMAVRIVRGELADSNDRESILSFLRSFLDDHHQTKEEFILFPALLRASHGDDHECLCKLIFEHNRERSLVEGIEEAMATRKTEDFVYYAHRFVDIVRSHVADEEKNLFQHADALLSPEEDERMVREIGLFDTPAQRRTLIALLKGLATLELKYLGASGESKPRMPGSEVTKSIPAFRERGV